MISLITIAAARSIAADAAAAPKPTAPSEPAGMVSMFDGKTLEGWDGDPRFGR